MKSEQEIRAYMDNARVGILSTGHPGLEAPVQEIIGFTTAMSLVDALAWVLGEAPENYEKELVERMATFAAEVRAASAVVDPNGAGRVTSDGVDVEKGGKVNGS